MYRYYHAGHDHSHRYLLPVLDEILDSLKPERIFDVGCGNGSVANHLSRRFNVDGVEVSEDAVRIANKAFPHLRIERGSAYDDLAQRFGRYPVVISLEVVEHLYSPRQFARTVFDLVEPGGSAIISTPYHGYLKNLALALTGKLDGHFTALWDHGHIKFWSEKSLGSLLREAGFASVRFKRAGRFAPLAKSMLAIARKQPGGGRPGV
jgi:2-polyprenyl-3-methyl-5-hydroxy-6-metoxy-1,4-benzoquinol methylase